MPPPKFWGLAPPLGIELKNVDKKNASKNHFLIGFGGLDDLVGTKIYNNIYINIISNSEYIYTT